MKYSDATRIMMLEHRIKLLSLNENQNVGLIRKAKRQLRALKEKPVYVSIQED